MLWDAASRREWEATPAWRWLRGGMVMVAWMLLGLAGGLLVTTILSSFRAGGIIF